MFFLQGPYIIGITGTESKTMVSIQVNGKLQWQGKIYLKGELFQFMLDAFETAQV